MYRISSRRAFSLISFLVIALSIPIVTYFLTKDLGDFDLREEAASATYTVCPKEGTGCDFVGGDGIQAAINIAADSDIILIKADPAVGTGQTKYTRTAYSEFVFNDNDGTKHKKVALNLLNKTITIRAENNVVLDGSTGPTMGGIGKTGYKMATVENLIISGFRKDNDCNDRETFCSPGTGVYLIGDGLLSLKSSQILNNSEHGVFSRGNGLLTLLSTTISGNGIHAIVGGNYMVIDITSSNISNNGKTAAGSAFFLANDVTMNITGSIVKENGLSGIQAMNRTKVTATSNLIIKNPEHGIDLADNTTLIATNNTIANNSSMGIKMGCGEDPASNPAVSLVNNIIANNTGGYGVGGECSMASGKLGNDTFSYTLLWGNKNDNAECGNTHLCASNCGAAGCTGMIWDKDPLFTSATDYHLKTGSPAIDTGISALVDPNGTRSDMGAYGGPKACKLDNTLTGCTGCTPQCTGKVCGSNGCGGTCGTCPTGKTCNASGQCTSTCVPACSNKDCGSDGCGGSCGTCPTGKACSATGTCVSSTLVGDLNLDGKITVSDYALFIADYLQYKKDGSVNERSDFNDDGQISVADYSLFVAAYLDFNQA